MLYSARMDLFVYEGEPRITGRIEGDPSHFKSQFSFNLIGGQSLCEPDSRGTLRRKETAAEMSISCAGF